jgi:hypothetical protein
MCLNVGAKAGCQDSRLDLRKSTGAFIPKALDVINYRDRHNYRDRDRDHDRDRDRDLS